MTARTRIHRSVPLGALLACVALTLWSASCNQDRAAGARATPSPGFSGIDAATREQVNAYADSLVFDTTAPGMDSTSFTTAAGVSHVRAEPEIGATSVSRDNLWQGRIIGRIRTSGVASPLGMPVGDVYLWVDSTPGSGWRMIAMPRDSANRVATSLRLLPFRSIDRPQMKIDAATLMIYGPCDWVICPFSDTTRAACYWTDSTGTWRCPAYPSAMLRKTDSAAAQKKAVPPAKR
jgi:hypothetical protein